MARFYWRNNLSNYLQLNSRPNLENSSNIGATCNVPSDSILITHEELFWAVSPSRPTFEIPLWLTEVAF